MKHKFLFAFALALLIVIPASAQVVNLVTNPGFESGTTGWTTTNASQAQDDDHICGTYSNLVTPGEAYGYIKSSEFMFYGGMMCASAWIKSANGVTGTNVLVSDIAGITPTVHVGTEWSLVVDAWGDENGCHEAPPEHYYAYVNVDSPAFVDSVWLSSESNDDECLDVDVPQEPSTLDLDMGELLAYSGVLFNALFPVFAVVTGWSVGLWLLVMIGTAVRNAINGMR